MNTNALSLAQDVGHLEAAITTAASVSALSDHAVASRVLTMELIAADASSAWVTHVISHANDQVVRRALSLVESRHRLPPATWCWLGLGSEGRMEQTLVTDQDNGLLFIASGDSEARALRERFLPFAQEVNEVLARCGFPLCDGNVMAGNSAWCLSLDEWRDCFTQWIRTPDPVALLNASIFFDFRALAGDAGLAERLRKILINLARGNEIFLRMMTLNALAAESPLGRLRDFVLAPDGLLDLKKFGSRIFVDAARILALAQGVSAVGTVPRLRTLGSQPDNRAAIQAFLALQDLRLHSQANEVADNRIDPAQLNEFDRAVLLESLRQARGLQRRLKTRFQIET
jgi:CBS domain-containing protein